MTTNPMVAQVESVPELLTSQFDQLQGHVESVLSHEEWRTIQRVVTTGCGDSHMSTVATQWAMERLGGVPTEAATSLRAARYGLPASGMVPRGRTLVIAVSVSGAVSRTQETIAVGREMGALTVALTGNPGSPLGQMAERILDCRIPDFVAAPGVRSYRISLLALWQVAIHMGVVRGHISAQEEKDALGTLRSLADAASETIDLCRKPAQELAASLSECLHFTFVGGGPNYATALFSAAKILEAFGRDAWGQDTEEWAHLQYFSRINPKSPTLVIDADGPGSGRMKEILGPMQRIGREISLIAPQDSALAPLCKHHLPVAKGVDPLFAPMVNAIPGELLSAYLAEATGEPHFGGFTGVYDSSGEGGNNIYNSHIAKVSELT